MKIIATRGSNVLSKSIQWGLNTQASHIAVVFDDRVVFHSNLLGTHLKMLPSFLKHSKIVKEITYNLTLEQEEEVWQNLIKYDEHSYDFPGFLFATGAVLKNKMFDVPLPSKNEWQREDKFLCTEIINAMPDYILKEKPDLAIISPDKLMALLEEQLHGRNHI